MILSATIALAAGWAAAEDGDPPPPEPPPPIAASPPPADDDALSPYRVDLDSLVERTIGTSSVPVAFDWRRTPVQLALTGGYLAELNNFNGMRVGGMARIPTGQAILELGAAFADSWESPTSRQLALTPYRQPGHPDRLELDVGLGLPLAEGVVTTAPKPFPAVQMVFEAYADLRYVLYPGAFAHLKPGEVLAAVISPSLSPGEIQNLDAARLPAMTVDPARYNVLLGFGDDLYFKSGLFVSPRVMLAVPVLSPITRTQLYVWADLSLAIGIAL